MIAPSRFQHSAVLQHINQKERELTFAELGTSELLQLQGGVFFFRKSAAVLDLFAAWRAEWERFKDQDHAALLRSLECSKLFVAAASLLNPRRFAAAIGAPCQSVSKYLAPSIPAPKNGEDATPTETYSGT